MVSIGIVLDEVPHGQAKMPQSALSKSVAERQLKVRDRTSDDVFLAPASACRCNRVPSLTRRQGNLKRSFNLQSHETLKLHCIFVQDRTLEDESGRSAVLNGGSELLHSVRPLLAERRVLLRRPLRGRIQIRPGTAGRDLRELLDTSSGRSIQSRSAPTLWSEEIMSPGAPKKAERLDLLRYTGRISQCCSPG